MFSCSSDDTNESSAYKISFKVNGVAKNFDNVTVTSENEGSYLRVEAVDETQTISFLLFPESNAQNSFSGFDIMEDGNYYIQSEEFSSNVTAVNMNGGRLKGSFSGTINGFDGNGNVLPTKTITNGRFDFTY